MPAVAALADEARRALARQTGRKPEDIELDVRALPGAGDRVLVFREAGGRQVSLPAGAALPSNEARGIGAALADWNVIAGVGLGFRVVPGVFSTGAMATASRFSDRDGVAAHLRAGASTTVGGGAFVWQLDGGPRPVGPAVAIAAPFVSSERDPLVGDKLELSIPGYVTPRRRETRGGRRRRHRLSRRRLAPGAPRPRTRTDGEPEARRRPQVTGRTARPRRGRHCGGAVARDGAPARAAAPRHRTRKALNSERCVGASDDVRTT
jgi:hypothetical protein